MTQNGQTKCIPCPSSSVYVTEDQQCKCQVMSKVPLYFFDNASSACHSCPSQSLKQNYVCTCDSAGYFWAMDNNSCVSPCPSNMIFVDGGCECALPAQVLDLHTPGSCICAPEYFNFSKVCTPCPLGAPPSADQSTCTCPSGTTLQIPTTYEVGYQQFYTVALCICTDTYSHSTALNGTACVACGTGAQMNTTTRQCECDNKFFSWYKGCTAPPSCATGQYVTPLGMCARCLNGSTPTFFQTGCNCAVINSPGDYLPSLVRKKDYYNISTQLCMGYCPEAFVLGFLGAYCELCPANSVDSGYPVTSWCWCNQGEDGRYPFWNQFSNKCLPCSEISIVYNDQCISCPAGTYSDGGAGCFAYDLLNVIRIGVAFNLTVTDGVDGPIFGCPRRQLPNNIDLDHYDSTQLYPEVDQALYFVKYLKLSGHSVPVNRTLCMPCIGDAALNVSTGKCVCNDRRFNWDLDNTCTTSNPCKRERSQYFLPNGNCAQCMGATPNAGQDGCICNNPLLSYSVTAEMCVADCFDTNGYRVYNMAVLADGTCARCPVGTHLLYFQCVPESGVIYDNQTNVAVCEDKRYQTAYHCQPAYQRGLSTGAMAGGIVGIILVVGAVIALTCLCYQMRKVHAQISAAHAEKREAMETQKVVHLVNQMDQGKLTSLNQKFGSLQKQLSILKRGGLSIKAALANMEKSVSDDNEKEESGKTPGAPRARVADFVASFDKEVVEQAVVKGPPRPPKKVKLQTRKEKEEGEL